MYKRTVQRVRKKKPDQSEAELKELLLRVAEDRDEWGEIAQSLAKAWGEELRRANGLLRGVRRIEKILCRPGLPTYRRFLDVLKVVEQMEKWRRK